MTPLKMWRSWRKVLKKHRDKCPSSTHRYNVDQKKLCKCVMHAQMNGH